MSSHPTSEFGAPVDFPLRVGVRGASPGRRPWPIQWDRAVVYWISALLIFFPVGCRRSEVLGKVYGKVSFRGEPVSEGVILFANQEKGIHMMAKLRSDGSYTVETASGAGLPLGTYQVSITPPVLPPDPKNPPPSRERYGNIPEKYSRPETSELTLTVNEGENRLDVDMKP